MLKLEFNSTLVRFREITNIVGMDNLKYFNSTLVRFREDQFLDATAELRISIPLWYDLEFFLKKV